MHHLIHFILDLVRFWNSNNMHYMSSFVSMRCWSKVKNCDQLGDEFDQLGLKIDA